ncbi:MAG: hypothetical protein LUC60_03940 [Lachnospiraceae bacterium]|nr:hypothetical protein [Lachnospiraceae bacterium]
MNEIIEEFISGFCRSGNCTKTVCCEYEQQPDGSFVLSESDCDFENCPNSASCLIREEALADRKRS